MNIFRFYLYRGIDYITPYPHIIYRLRVLKAITKLLNYNYTQNASSFKKKNLHNTNIHIYSVYIDTLI